MPANKPGNEVPDSAEFGQLVAFLARNRPSGVAQPEWVQIITDNVGVGADGRTRAEIVEALIAWMQGFELE